jgi:hypothetical protein
MRALYQAFSKTFSRTLSRINTEKIEFSHQFYLTVPPVELTLVFLTLEGGDSTQVPLDKAKELFKSIKSACDHGGITEIELGELFWKTDARDEGQVAVQYRGSQGSVHTTVERSAVTAAIADFSRRFGLN